LDDAHLAYCQISPRQLSHRKIEIDRSRFTSSMDVMYRDGDLHVGQEGVG
jgi:hypothetical protein